MEIYLSKIFDKRYGWLLDMFGNYNKVVLPDMSDKTIPMHHKGGDQYRIRTNGKYRKLDDGIDIHRTAEENTIKVVCKKTGHKK